MTVEMYASELFRLIETKSNDKFCDKCKRHFLELLFPDR